MLVCSVSLWYFLIVLTYFFQVHIEIYEDLGQSGDRFLFCCVCGGGGEGGGRHKMDYFVGHFFVLGHF